MIQAGNDSRSLRREEEKKASVTAAKFLEKIQVEVHKILGKQTKQNKKK